MVNIINKTTLNKSYHNKKRGAFAPLFYNINKLI